MARLLNRDNSSEIAEIRWRRSCRRITNTDSQPKVERRHHKEVHCGNASRMVPQKRLASMAPTLLADALLCHVLADHRPSNLDPELQQLAMNTGSAPQWVLRAYSPDQAPNFSRDLGRPLRERDFHRLYNQKPDRCQQGTALGWTIVTGLLSDGNICRRRLPRNLAEC
jgi:hypothetical protein